MYHDVEQVQLLTPKGRIGNEMRIADQLRDRREEILRVAAKHSAGKVFVFGSVARGEETADSDVDLLVDVAGELRGFLGGWSRIWKNCSDGGSKSSSVGR